MTTTFDDASTIRSQHAALRRRRLGKNRMQRGDDRHGQPRQQRHDVAARVAAENAEFMLEGDDVEPAGIQEVGRAHVIVDPVVVDLKADGGGIVVDVAMVGHRHDAGLHARARRGDRLLQIGREGGDAAAARQRIADECHTV